MTVKMQTILSDAYNVASLPMIYGRINEMVERSPSDEANICAVIGADTGLSVRVLRLANSAYRGKSGRIDSIERALTIIGVQPLRDLARATSMMHTFKNIPEDIINMHSFWQHSIACGVAARSIALHLDEPNVERYYLGGMLHDIGRLILLQNLPAEEYKIMLASREQGSLVVELERKEFGLDHAEIGAELMHIWNLPTNLTNMVRGHHRPQKAKKYRAAAAIIHVADLLAHTLQLGVSGEWFIPRLDEAAWNLLNIAPHLLPMIGKQIHPQYDSAIAVMLSG